MKKIQCPNCGNYISVAWAPFIVVTILSQIIILFGGAFGIYFIKGDLIPLGTFLWVFPLLFMLGCVIVFPIVVYAYYYLVPMVNKNA